MGDDPEQYLRLDPKAQMEATTQAFDSKKNCWVPDEKEGFVKAEVLSTKGDMVTVKTVTGKQVTLKKDDTQQMNPPKFDKSEDMASMTFLNEASVLGNLRQRYQSGLIYTYSGLFCVAVNPYRRLPIYSDKVVALYRGKRRNEMPPHVYAVADNAYYDMLQDNENQSMLITGESGAGKTENTKKVIQYFASIASSASKEPQTGEKKGLEEQVIQTNPPLEAFGNAKTIRNDNSSRFGKFIRIHFGGNGKLAGADIETYLLEKSRVVTQLGGERAYHIFYQILSGGIDGLLEKLALTGKPEDYNFTSQGVTTIDNVDDKQEMCDTDKALDVLGFIPEDKLSMWKLCAAILHFGNAKWKQRPREEQAESDGTEQIDAVSYLLGLNAQDLMKNLLKPRIKVGTEYVQQGRTKEQVAYSVNALSKAIYNKLFGWLVSRVNTTLDTKSTKAFFIGVLDIAGFEIFDFNTFEQLCINLTNEKLQQFFNHHMFVLEQEEYKREGIDWEFIDFGMDLENTIQLIEGKMSVFDILEEECMMPKASDKTFTDKLVKQHKGKHPNFGTPSLGKKKGVSTSEYHFEVHHYAGTVGYNTDFWLDKNKDPLNEAVVDLFRKGTEHLLPKLFSDIPTGGGGKREKAIKTISAGHREQLNRLLSTLFKTSPHFVRCIIPNEFKKPGLMDAHLVLHQLSCNGVLEGIRICRKGFPNRMSFADFKQRYTVLAPTAVPGGFMDSRKASDALLKAIQLDTNEYRMGYTKVFFRAGCLGELEDMRDERLSKIVSMLQSQCRGFIMRKEYKKMLDQRIGLSTLQRNIRKYLILRNWHWWRLYTKVKPLLNVARAEDEMKAKEEELQKFKEKAEKEEKERIVLEEKNSQLLKEKNEMMLRLQNEQEQGGDYEETINKLNAVKTALETRMQEMQERIEEEEDNNADISATKHKLEKECSELKKDIDDLEITLAKVEDEKKAREAQIKTLNEDLAAQDESIAKLTKEKQGLDEKNKRTEEALQAEEDKCNHLNHLKAKLESSIDELEDNLEHEKKARGDVEKVKRKLEGDLKMTQETVEELERAKSGLQENLKKREYEITQLNSRLEDEQGLVAQLQKKIKELQARIEELEEELDAERQARTKVEKQRTELSHELEDLSERLEEQGGATAVQIDLNKKRESEISKMKRELEDAHMQSEATSQALRKKHQDAVAELSEQVDALNRTKSKIDKERQNLKMDIDDLVTTVEGLQKSKNNAEKLSHQLESQLNEANGRADDLSRSIAELNNHKQRMTNENADLLRQLEESENGLSHMGKQKSQLGSQIDELRRQLDEESRAKSQCMSQIKNLNAECDQLRDQAEEEAEGRAEVQRLLGKANAEIQAMRAKYEGDHIARAEELEEARRRLQIKLTELEDQLQNALSKNSTLEKTKQRLSAEIEDLLLEVERANSMVSALEKKQKKFDQFQAEWKAKVDEVTVELEISQKEARSYSAELFKFKGFYEETLESIETLKRENKNLSDEIHDLTDQLGEGGKSIHELDKIRRRLEMEKEELQTTIDEVESQLEQEESKVVRYQLEITQVKADIERRLSEKDEEFEVVRKSHAREIESLTATLESETRQRNEAMKLKKKLESEVNELEIQLDHTNKNLAEALKNNKRLQGSLKDLQAQLDDEIRARDELRDQYQLTERRCNMLSTELEELRSQLEQSERMRRSAEGELSDANDRNGELGAQNHSLAGQKRRLEQELLSARAEADEASAEARANDDRAKKAVSDATRLAEELRHEQDQYAVSEKNRKVLEVTVKELQVRIEEAEALGIKAARRQMQKLEVRIRELEQELDGEQRRRCDIDKNMRKGERRIKELNMIIEDEHKVQQHMQETVEKWTMKCKTLKKQTEELEEHANGNLSKFKRAQTELEEAEERADIAESALQKLRARHRSAMTQRTTTTKTGNTTITTTTKSSKK
ncbi:uncharacterized protein [Antedon mediterranea]|uniref:uncharacterized protein isoform X2 n=1 Tax=Antedon mediterranea TaxID=105859 RepID=UPI003AF4DC95